MQGEELQVQVKELQVQEEDAELVIVEEEDVEAELVVVEEVEEELHEEEPAWEIPRKQNYAILFN